MNSNVSLRPSDTNQFSFFSSFLGFEVTKSYKLSPRSVSDAPDIKKSIADRYA